MTANHTPGPWKAVHLVKTKYSPEHYEIQFGNDGECIAEYVHEPADAHLIAAAPDLLQALEHVLENYKHNNNQGLGLGPIIQAEAAIKKARGQE